MLCRTLFSFNQLSLSPVCIPALVLIHILLYYAKRRRWMQNRSGVLYSFAPSTTTLHHYWVFTLVLRSVLSVFVFISLSICLFVFIAAYCSPPNNPVNGTVHSLTGTKLGSTLRFNCDQGFRLIGQSSATCTRTAQGIHQWNAPVPLCQGEGSIIARVGRRTHIRHDMIIL